jgi:hypothetical protein
VAKNAQKLVKSLKRTLKLVENWSKLVEIDQKKSEMIEDTVSK